MVDEKSKSQKVIPKENQIFLHHEKYNIDYVIELVPGIKQVELIFEFLNCDLTEEQKDEIAIETRNEISKVFSIEDL